MKRNLGGERDLDHIIIAAIHGMERACLAYGVRAGLIFCLAREFDYALNDIIVRKAERYRDRGVVGIDLAGPEQHTLEFGGEVDRYHDLFARARAAGLGTTIHTGETSHTGADGVFAVLEKLQPDRIGHGIAAARSEELMKRLRDRGTVLELCPSSNLRTRALSGWDEPARSTRAFATRACARPSTPTALSAPHDAPPRARAAARARGLRPTTCPLHRDRAPGDLHPVGGAPSPPNHPTTEDHVKRQVISTDQGPRTGLPYSQAIRHGDLVFVAGQVALDPATGQVVAGDIRAQTRQVLENIQAILRAAGTSLDHAVECLCLLSNIGDFAAFNEVYRGFFPKDRRRGRRSRPCCPARACWWRSGRWPRCRRPARPSAPRSRPAAPGPRAAAGRRPSDRINGRHK